MNHQFTVKVSETHVRCAVQKFFFSTIGKAIPGLFVLAALALALIIFGPQLGWLYGALVGGLSFCVILFFMLYAVLLEKRLVLLQKYGGVIDYQLSEELFKSKSGWALLETRWEIFQTVLVSPKIWLLYSKHIGYFVFPTEQTSDDVRDFLKRKIISVGGKIK